ncbi:sterol desaturase family protein [Novosphingobium sp. BL-8A]|uniref:sterol desaturase family protein n=1 Tax=Novosphingobium sp. BL-8A TaxID=3127639 RepID=UPI003756E99E
MKRIVFTCIQPAAIAAIIAFWALAPASLTTSWWTLFAGAVVTKLGILALERVNERHASWRLTRTELLTDLFYVALGYTVIRYARKHWGDAPLEAAKNAIGISTPWLEHAPFLLQVALIVFLIEFSQYWMHRAMHNWYPLWLTHAPHHYVTQLNALKGAVGNPIELFLIGLSVVTLFDFSLTAAFCAAHVLTAVAAFAHANVRFDPPRWYAYLFTTVEHHSLHHSTDYESTRCNYANALILCDRMFGTFRDGEAAEVGQDGQRRLSIREQFMFPFAPLVEMMKTRRDRSAVHP